ncbi:MAG: hypothetical protein D3910_02300 [Candidatus Electrothrix sp. ATG2]|nr:hypothetical protein [Candidatus Electrothrix sp. ATG2]
MLHLFFNRLRRSSFVTNVITLAGGALLTKAITLLCSPILTRLYSPADFGLLAVFLAVVSSLSPAVCGQYEVAMVLPKSHKQGVYLLGISLRVAIAFSFIFLVGVIFFDDHLLALLNAEQLGGWMFVAPVALFFFGLMNAMKCFANRHKDYGTMAKVNVMNSLTVAVSGIVFGLLGVGFKGLLVSFMIGQICSTSFLYISYLDKLPVNMIRWDTKKTILMKRYIDYPIYNASTGLLNGLFTAMPIFFLTHYFPVSVVGYYSIVTRVAKAPLSFIATSVSQVNLRKVVELRNDGGNIRLYLIKVTIGLAAIMLPPILLLFFFSPEIFTLLFGEEWQEAGTYMQILIPALFIKFIASSLSTTLPATQNNRIMAIWKITAFMITLIVYLLFAPQQDPMLFLKAIAVTEVILYLLYYIIIMKSAIA